MTGKPQDKLLERGKQQLGPFKQDSPAHQDLQAFSNLKMQIRTNPMVLIKSLSPCIASHLHFFPQESLSFSSFSDSQLFSHSHSSSCYTVAFGNFPGSFFRNLILICSFCSTVLMLLRSVAFVFIFWNVMTDGDVPGISCFDLDLTCWIVGGLDFKWFVLAF